MDRDVAAVMSTWHHAAYIDQARTAYPVLCKGQELAVGWKITNIDATTYGGYLWPITGHPVLHMARDWDDSNYRSCPNPWRNGDGLCLVTTSTREASSGGVPLGRSIGRILVYPATEARSDATGKHRVPWVIDVGVFDPVALIREGLVPGLSGANLSGANLYGADLSRANLSWANLHGADLSGANLHGADLSVANLSGADLSVANLSWANLHGANLSGADLSRADLSVANLSRANLSGADLSRANLSVADLSGANLSGANLSRANLSVADLSGANLSGANLSGADLSRANLSVADLSGANLHGATASSTTRWPSQFAAPSTVTTVT